MSAFVVAFVVGPLAGVLYAAPACPGTATVAVMAENLSDNDTLTLMLEGELRDATATCESSADASYATTLICHGTGLVRCGVIAGLRPGAWVHRMTAAVEGSDTQVQSQTTVILTGGPRDVSNSLTWRVYPRTFVVHTPSENDLRAALDAAGRFSEASGGPALITFDRNAFPGAATPVAIPLTSGVCASDRRRAALCVDGSRIVVDALDDNAERGAVVLAPAGRPGPLVRVYGSDNVLRGLVFTGSTDATLSLQADTVAIVGGGALRNRLEQCAVYGPAKGDAVSVDSGAGQSGEAADANVIEDCELTGARDKGLKLATGGRALLRDSCVHDNQNGGVEVTLGSDLTAIHNLIQHNVPGSSQSGIAAGATGDGTRNVVATQGNIVRFSGARGLSVTDAADAVFRDDYVADNQFTGARVESTMPGVAPSASFSGVAFVCNHNGGITGSCRLSNADDSALCTTDADCCADPTQCCASDPECAEPARCAPPAPQGFGVVAASCPGCIPPDVDLGRPTAAGWNALALNVNSYPNARGANLLVGAPRLGIQADGDQWEHCGTGPTCDMDAVTLADVQLGAGASVSLGAPPGPRAGTPIALMASKGRAHAGELVRIFGRNFNAIDGAACAKATTPVAPCSASNPRVAQANRAGRWGNRVLVTMAGQSFGVDVDAVTPTMIAFTMPFDCFAAATVQVSKRDVDGTFRRSDPIVLCDPADCVGRPAGTACDDADACTVGDACDGEGRCVSTGALQCGGDCMGCDAEQGCVPLGADASCDDGNACTVGDHCRGDADACVPGAPRVCAGACLIGTCDPTSGCIPRPDDAPCNDGSVCTVGDHCRGDADVCVSGPPLVCAGQCLTGRCDARAGCMPRPPTARCDDADACTTGDHCDGRADACLQGQPVDCDDGDPCTIESCDVAVGCKHDAVTGFDAIRCRFTRSDASIHRALGTGSAARLLGRVFAQLGKTTSAAQLAHANGANGKARRLLDHLRARLLTLATRLPRRRLPARLVDLLRTDLVEAVAALEEIRVHL